MSLVLAAVALGCAAVAWHDRRSASRSRRRDLRAGGAGERMVAARLAKEGFHSIHDYHLVHRGRTVQVDHLVLCHGSIVCLETKHWAGEIAARTDGGDWAVTTRSGNTSRRHSPVTQNEWHVAALSDALGVPVRGVIVFTCPSGKLVGSVPATAVRLSGLARTLGTPPRAPSASTAATWAGLLARKADGREQARIARAHLARMATKPSARGGGQGWAMAALAAGAGAITSPSWWPAWH